MIWSGLDELWGILTVWKFVVCSFLFLGWGFYELSGGSEFQAPVQKERVTRNLATYDVPANSTQTIPTLAAAAPSNSGETETSSQNAEVETAAAETPVVQTEPASFVQEIGASSPRPQARAAGLLVVGTGETFNPTATTATVAAVEEVEDAAQDTEITIAASADLRRVSGNRVNMRGGPSTDFGVLATLTRGEEVEVLETPGNGWVKLMVVASGQEGWMAERLLTR